MQTHRSSTEIIIAAMRILADDIICEDGVATAAIYEAANRLEELEAENERLRKAPDMIVNNCIEIKTKEEKDE